MRYFLGFLVLVAALLAFIFISGRGGARQTATPQPLPSMYTYAPVDPQSPTFKYLAFQIFTPPADSGLAQQNLPPTEDLERRARSIVDRIGATGSGDRMIAFVVGPLTFDHSDADIRALIDQSFAIAEKYDIAVGFHIDDSMFWEQDAALAEPQNIEWINWSGTPYTGRRLDWSATPAKIAPQLCLNSASVVAAVAARGALIGQEIAKHLSRLKQERKGYLFAGVIAGWETQIGVDFDTGAHGGYCALANAGYSSASSPADLDHARETIVRHFIDEWAQTLAENGVPEAKIYSHVAFTPQASFHPASASETYSASVNFAPPQVAFGPRHNPGFSTYPAAGLNDALYAVLAQHGDPSWASSEGAAIDPALAAQGGGGIGTEAYLTPLFNHGATLVNIYGWGVGPPEFPFRKIAEGDEAVAAYRKFLSGEMLVAK